MYAQQEVFTVMPFEAKYEAVMGNNAQQVVVAVMPFGIKGNAATRSEADTATSHFSSELANARIFKLASRVDIDAAVKTEFARQMSNWSDKRKTAQLGKALNAQWLIKGTISKKGKKIELSVELFDLNTMKQQSGGTKYTANIDDMFDAITPLVKEISRKLDSASTTQNFVRIKGGTFTMGGPSSEVGRDSDETQHQVTVSGFYMSNYEVTQTEYEAVMGSNPSSFKGGNLPVENVSWYDAIEYCNKRSLKEGLKPAYKGTGDSITCDFKANGYRLPTEAEWEYACRAGTKGPFNTGTNITTSQANYNGDYPYNNNSNGEYRAKTTAVGSFAPNDWGLYDMHGNVREWCWDWFGDYSSGRQTNPSGAASGYNRVDRGGNWYTPARSLRSAFRSYYSPSYKYDGLGFRLARS
jgi:formylglycine-generating enzyme required for sulfatase activity